MNIYIKILSLIAILVVLIGITGCENNEISTATEGPERVQQSQESFYALGGSRLEFPLYSSNNELRGYLIVSNDSQNLYINFGTSSGWLLASTDLQVSPNQPNVSRNESAKPAENGYSISNIHRNYVREYNYSIALSEARLRLGELINLRAGADVVKHDQISDKIDSERAVASLDTSPDNRLEIIAQYRLSNDSDAIQRSVRLDRSDIVSPY